MSAEATRSPAALRFFAAFTTLLGADNSLQSLNTSEVPDGACAIVRENNSFYQFSRGSTAAVDGVTVIGPASGPGRWTILFTPVSPDIPSAEANVMAYGAVGDGVHDDTSAIQAAIDAAEVVHGCVLFPPGTYRVTATLEVEEGVNFDLRCGATIAGEDVPIGDPIVHIFGTADAAVALTADTLKLSASNQSLTAASTVTVADTSSFTEGQSVLLLSDGAYETGADPTLGKRALISRVASLTPTTIVLESVTEFNFTVADNATISPLNMVDGFSFTGGHITGGGPGDDHIGILIEYCLRPSVEDVGISLCDACGIQVEYTEGADINTCMISDQQLTDGAAILFINAAKDCLARRNVINDCIRAVVGAGEYTTIFCTVDGNSSYTSTGAGGYVAAESAFNWDFSDNKVYSAETGFFIRGSGHMVKGNQIIGCETGVVVRSSDPGTNSAGIRDVYIMENVIDQCDTAGIFLDGQRIGVGPVILIVDSIVSSNRITNIIGDGILCRGITGADIIDNDINGCFAVGANGIDITSSIGVPTVSDNANVALRGNSTRNTTQRGIAVSNTTGLEIEGSFVNTVTTAATQTMIVSSCLRVKVLGGTYDGSSNTAAVITFQDCNQILVDGVTCLGNSGAAAQDGIVTTTTGAAYERIRITNCNINAPGRFAISVVATADHVLISGNDVSSAVNATKINFSAPAPAIAIVTDNDFFIQTFTVAAVPAAASNTGRVINTTNGWYGQPGLARSDGTNWKLLQDGSVTTTIPLLTIAGGVVTATNDAHRIDTEGAGATDDLDTINGVPAGQRLVIYAAASARTVVVKDGTGNLNLAGDFTMDNSEDRLTLISDGTNLFELSRSDNGA